MVNGKFLLPLHPHFKNCLCNSRKCYKVLFYGVMAALGFLVPSVQVRILVEQPIFDFVG